jgi:UDP-N-acetylglucosamine--N-acetylmuramyl-(pentapeptide) pyrophosphoryl-undecaprenol N-acetylglucosamine transferase
MNLAITAGGTGGHIYPGIGVAEHALETGFARKILFIGARRGLESTLVPEAGFELKTLSVGRVRGMKLGARISGLAGLGLSIPQARKLLRRFSADAVVGLGGYASAPSLIAGSLSGIPTVLCEQNTIPGSTNRFLSRFARTICVSFAMSSGYLPSQKVVVTGNPTRRDIAEARKARAVRVSDGTFTIVVLGGSQGALFLNQTIARSLAAFAQKRPAITIVHQTGRGRLEEAQDAYAKLGAQAQLIEYVDDMAGLLTRADLVVGRAGATTVAELTAVGVPAVLVPFPYATDNHQYWNAMEMVRAKAAFMHEQDAFNGATFAQDLEGLFDGSGSLDTMSANARRLGRVDAAANVLEQLRRLS